MKPEDLQKAPKLFCENVISGSSAEGFVIGLSSGGQAQFYAFTPAHMKRLVQKMTYDLEQFEKKYGEITAKWDPDIVSPIQKLNPPPEAS